MRILLRFALAVALICGLIGQANAESAPAVVGNKGEAPAKPTTWHDYYAQLLTYNRETLSGAYQKVGKHGPWDADAVKFLDEMARSFTSSGMDTFYAFKEPLRSYEELAAAGKALLAAGCDDPLILYCVGVKMEETKHPDEALKLVRKAAAGLEAAGYPSIRIIAAAQRLMRLDPSAPTRAQYGQVSGRHELKLASGKLGDIQRRVALKNIWERLSDQPREDEVDFVEELRKQADADPWVLNVLDGCVETQIAWDSRGGGTIDTVTREGMQGFIQHLKKARDSLTAAYKLAPNLPEASTEMIPVAMGGGGQLGEQISTWFDRAEAAQLDFDDAYARMFSALLPRWGGDYGKMYQLGLHGMQTGRFDTNTPWQLVKAVLAIGNDTGESFQSMLKSQPSVYAALSDVAEKYAVAEGERDPENAAWMLSFRAALARQVGDYREAREVLDKIGAAGLQPAAFTSASSQNPAAAIGQIYAMTGPQAADAKAAEASLKAERYDEAIAAFRTMMTAATPDELKKAKPYFEARISLADRQQKLAHGEWVDIQPVERLHGWKWFAGKWKVEPDGKLSCESDGRSMPCIRLDESLGTRVEMSGVLEPSEEKESRPGFLLATSQRPFLFIWVARGGLMLTDANGQNREIFPSEALNTIDGPLPFRFTCDAGTFSIELGGKTIMEKRALPEDPGNDLHLGLSSAGPAYFTQLKVRKIVPSAKSAAP